MLELSLKLISKKGFQSGLKILRKEKKRKETNPLRLKSTFLKIGINI